MPKQTRKSTDGMGVVIWWYDNEWRIRRSAPGYGPFTYTVEGSLGGSAPYRWAGEFESLAAARKAISNPVDKWPGKVDASAIIAKMDGFAHSYVVAALFCGVERKDDDPLKDNDKLYDVDIYDVDAETLNTMVADCAKFQDEARDIITAAAETGECVYGPDCTDEFERAGHDFWMTRNHHGVGFWDGDWPEPMAKQLTDLAHKYGEFDLYMGDDDRVYAL